MARTLQESRQQTIEQLNAIIIDIDTQIEKLQCDRAAINSTIDVLRGKTGEQKPTASVQPAARHSGGKLSIEERNRRISEGQKLAWAAKRQSAPAKIGSAKRDEVLAYLNRHLPSIGDELIVSEHFDSSKSGYQTLMSLNKFGFEFTKGSMNEDGKARVRRLAMAAEQEPRPVSSIEAKPSRADRRERGPLTNVPGGELDVKEELDGSGEQPRAFIKPKASSLLRVSGSTLAEQQSQAAVLQKLLRLMPRVGDTCALHEEFRDDQMRTLAREIVRSDRRFVPRNTGMGAKRVEL